MSGLAFLTLELVAVALVLILLNARDRRRDRVTAAVLSTCPATLRGLIAVHARGSLVSRGVVLTLDILADDDGGNLWMVVQQLAESRPSAVTVSVAARAGPARPVAVSVPARMTAI